MGEGEGEGKSGRLPREREKERCCENSPNMSAGRGHDDTRPEKLPDERRFSAEALAIFLIALIIFNCAVSERGSSHARN